MLIANRAKDDELNMAPMVSSEVEPKPKAPPKDRISRASLSFDPNEDDFDPRFLNTMASSEGADLNRRFFKNTTAEYMMAKCKNLERYNKDLFMQFIGMGSTLVDLATRGEYEQFKQLFVQAVDKEMMFWHITKAFKAAVKHK